MEWKIVRDDGSLQERAFDCSRKGLTIRGTEYRMNGKDLPIAIVCHGFMAAQDTVRHYTKLLARLGYAAYCFDFCGGSLIGGKSDGKTTQMSIRTEIEDLTAVMEYVLSLPYTREEGMLVMGSSQGGLVAALTAAQMPQRVKKLVLFEPAFCIPDDARSGKLMFTKFDPNQLPEVLWVGFTRLGREFVQDLITMDVYREIADYPGDVLIVHGTEDILVPLEYSSEAIDRYETAAIQQGFRRKAILRIIPGGRHGFSRQHDQQAMQYLTQFARVEPTWLADET